jgi:hypothetical protein
MAGGVLTLVVIQGLTGKGAGRVGALVDTLNGLVVRALDPTVPAIPDHSTADPSLQENPVSSGQASTDGSSGHNVNLPVVSPPTRLPIPAPAVHSLN